MHFSLPHLCSTSPLYTSIHRFIIGARDTYCGTKALGLYFQVMPKSALACVCCPWLPSGARTTGEAQTGPWTNQERLKSTLARGVCCPWMHTCLVRGSRVDHGPIRMRLKSDIPRTHAWVTGQPSTPVTCPRTNQVLVKSTIPLVENHGQIVAVSWGLSIFHS